MGKLPSENYWLTLGWYKTRWLFPGKEMPVLSASSGINKEAWVAQHHQHHLVQWNTASESRESPNYQGEIHSSMPELMQATRIHQRETNTDAELSPLHNHSCAMWSTIPGADKKEVLCLQRILNCIYYKLITIEPTKKLSTFHNHHDSWLSGKESTCLFRRCRFNPWFGKIPWRRK